MVMMMVEVVVKGEYGVCDNEGHGDGVAVKPGTVTTVVMTMVMVASLLLKE